MSDGTGRGRRGDLRRARRWTPGWRPKRAGRTSTFLTGALTALLCVLAVATPSRAQDVRGSALTTARYFEFRPIRQDTVPRAEVTEGPDGTLLFEGRPVTCRSRDICVLRRDAGVDQGVAITQDLGFTAWGFGVQGLSTNVQLRARTDVGGGGFVWPESDDHLDALVAYAQLVRGDFRIRLGRQRATSGLGFSSYDGASALYAPVPGLRLEAYGGRSLARGLFDPRHRALEGIEDFLVDRNAWLFGGRASLSLLPGTDVTARYQREIWSDRSGLLSERASLDARTTRLDPVTLEGSVDWDIGFDRIGKASLTASVPVPSLDLTVRATARRHVPYFEMWTIWGFFDPVGYEEIRLRADWSPQSDVGVWASAALRSYRDTDTELLFGPTGDDGRRLAVGGRWSPDEAWSVSGSYRLEDGFGTYFSSGDLRARWEADDRLEVSVHGSAFQQIQEFRVGEGVVFGGGGAAELSITDAVDLRGGLDVYRQTFENRPGTVDWNQVRGWSALRVSFGGDPGLERRGGSR